MAWRMPKQCDNCPFASKGKGLRLRKGLAPGRWREILAHLRAGGDFQCHKTTDETGDGSNLSCAGALEWQERHGYSSQMARIAERLEYFRQKREARQ